MTQRAFKKVELGEAKPTERHRLVADGLIHGKSCRKAAEDAGYGKTYAKCFGGRIARSPQVKQAMLELSKGIKLGELGNMAKVLLQEDLLKPPKEPKARHAVIRTGLEVDGLLGGPSELHLHQHSTLPPAVQKMLEDKMLELMNLKQPEVIDAETVPQGAESPDQDREDHARVQGRELAFGLESGTLSEVS